MAAPLGAFLVRVCIRVRFPAGAWPTDTELQQSLRTLTKDNDNTA